MADAERSPHTAAAFIILVVVATVVTTLAFYEANRTHRVASSNHRAIARLDAVTAQLHVLAKQQATFRVERAKRTTETDTLICKQVEKVKTALRVRENFDFSHLHRNLALLGIKPTPALIQLATREHARNLRLIAPINCLKLPTRSKVGLPK